jgi:methylenetetrahydrofolate dehydrogenase (NADP+) / methenyltetrahydrofolate cyclohydrolase
MVSGEKEFMPALIFDSKPLAARMTAELQDEAQQFRQQKARSARLAQIIVGHDTAA